MAHENLAPRIERIVRLAKEFRLDEHDARIALQLRLIEGEHHGMVDAHFVSQLEAFLDPYRAFHQEVPFVTAPRAALEINGYAIGQQLANNATITVSPDELARNLLVIGASGTGKTSILLTLADTLLASGVRVKWWDVKRDAQRLALRHPHVLVVHPDAPIHLLKKPAYLTLEEHFAIIEETFARSLYIGQTGRAVLHEALTIAFRESDDPTLRDVLRILQRLPKRGDSFDRINGIRSIEQRVQRTLDRYPGFAQRHGIAIDALCQASAIFSLVAMSDVEEFLLGYVATHEFRFHRANNIRALTSVHVVDEAMTLFRAEGGTSRISGNYTAQLVALTREWGTAWAFSANAAHLLEPSLLANIYTTIALNATSSDEAAFVARYAGLNATQRTYYERTLTRGNGIMRFADRWREPLLAIFAPWPHEKSVTSEEWTTALARISACVPVETQQTIVATPTMTDERIALNAFDEALVRRLSREDVLTMKELGHPQMVARSLRRLDALGFIGERGRILSGRRRGQSSIAIALSVAAYAWLGESPVRYGNGGLQARFLCKQLLRAIPDSTREFPVGRTNKRVDIFFRYSAQHDALLQRIGAPTLREGDSVAIEIEVSRPDNVANISLNGEAGVELTIIAVLPQDVQRALFTDALVVNVFDLLEAL